MTVIKSISPEGVQKEAIMNIDPNTGEILSSAVQPWYKRQYDGNTATQMQDVVGTRPVFMNLRDHDELDGQPLLIIKLSERSRGEYGDFYKIAVLFIDADGKVIKPAVIMTGAQDVIERVEAVSDLLEAGQPVKATLRKAGRAWLLE